MSQRKGARRARTAAALAPRWWWLLAGALLVGDAVLLAVHALHLRVNEPWEPTHPVLSDPRWDGGRDGSVIEVFGYVQLSVAAVLLVVLALRRAAPVYAAWAVVVAALVADDALELHERGGAVLVDALGLPAVAGLRPQDLGELSVWLLASLVIGAVVVAAHRLAEAPDRRRSWVMLLLVGVLALFAVGVDMVSSVVGSRLGGRADIAATLVETAGELLAMSLLLSVVVLMALRAGGHRPAAPS